MRSFVLSWQDLQIQKTDHAKDAHLAIQTPSNIDRITICTLTHSAPLVLFFFFVFVFYFVFFSSFFFVFLFLQMDGSRICDAGQLSPCAAAKLCQANGHCETNQIRRAENAGVGWN